MRSLLTLAVLAAAAVALAQTQPRPTPTPPLIFETGIGNGRQIADVFVRSNINPPAKNTCLAVYISVIFERDIFRVAGIDAG